MVTFYVVIAFLAFLIVAASNAFAWGDTQVWIAMGVVGLFIVCVGVPWVELGGDRGRKADHR